MMIMTQTSIYASELNSAEEQNKVSV